MCARPETVEMAHLMMAGVLRPHGLELAGGDALSGGAHGGGFGVVQDGDAGGGKSSGAQAAGTERRSKSCCLRRRPCPGRSLGALSRGRLSHDAKVLRFTAIVASGARCTSAGSYGFESIRARGARAALGERTGGSRLVSCW